MSKISSIKVTRNNLQKRDLEQSIKTLNQLAQRPNITIKKKAVLKNYNNEERNVYNPQNKVTNSQNNVTNSQNRVVKLQNHVDKQKIENKSANNMVVKKKIGLMEKLFLMKNVEYYPDHCKRNVHPKKIKLQPKHDYKVVAATNKRKRRIPHRGVNSIQPTVLEPSRQDSPALQVSPKEQLSLSSLVQLAEEQGLDDEDFMEILTCPSPVWWEDTSDEDDISFDEGFDGKTKKVLQNTHEIYKKSINANKIPIDNKLKRDINFFKKFVTKRSKLENILGNIKCKKIPETVHITNRGQIKDIDDANNSDEFTIDNEFRKRTRKYSLGLSDISINEEELVNIFESIEIPVKNIKDEGNDKNEIKNDIIMMEIRNKPIENNEMILKHVNKSYRRTKKPSKLINNELKLHVKRLSVTEYDELTNEADLHIVPAVLPPLTKNPFKNSPKAYESPKSIESVNSETTSIIELDSISDTNIKFLDEYVDNKEKTMDAVSVNKYEKGHDGELVTVYQILSNKAGNTDVDIEEQIKANLVNKSPQTKPDFNKNNSEMNLFFKTRKNAYRRSRSKYKKK